MVLCSTIVTRYGPCSGQQWFYVVPLFPAARLVAGNNGFMLRKTCFAGESYDLHARHLCSNFCSAV
jgi:hypothetical protein